MANWRAILSLFIIFAIIGLLIFSPKGQKIVGNKTAPVGSFLKTITGKVAKAPAESNIPKNLDVTITNVDPASLGDIEVQIKGDDFESRINYQVVSLLDSGIKFDGKEIDVDIKSLVGAVAFLRNGDMKITGKTNSLKLNEMEITKPGIDLLIVGQPVSFEINDIEKNEMSFLSISGLLKCPQLSQGNLMLKNDQLELSSFYGYIKQDNSSITISGQVDKMRLNGVDISRK
ncbi:MAG: hypothetical protein COY38_02050 [Candidatus Aenigmarchaeota archaeon CG_4_10_14_0_8_um_filter_37_24]|nr:MAG: hypothetical protein COS07_04500 [Candidatus Aenigmarchaeota archaeon CG01_land_8_20_14_3_00_37_9]PIY36326.1 MAG: hypothetical protein COZ04_00725 [Candidatus Aenigmarchaeota archaeon CG_4_10_14_3_um_filter_37_21]PIZ35635.1 MAG: hypothetical protein COY38_02050 [Candidatus Aenigmarchaeota archaeon CG_4_10_14_0_8_um_filter_37_24]PJB75283.1 MAG: hypothetical protein CO092_02280 [Candidatus Aenigmarchaeota archaeon CG_4_9_14_3_um_filter_37_18]